MIRVTTFFLAILLSATVLLAQTVDEARKDIYHGKYKTAKEKLNKILAANGKDPQAIYWLGQATIEDEDNIAGAKTVYQNALNSGVNDPIIWVGMGHVELLEGKKDAARQRFEAAIANTLDKKKKENPNILNAIGRANADGPANSGDPAYAIEKLKRAAELDPTNADIFVNLGINYLKLGSDQGGNAYEAYTNALKVEPTNAKAIFRLGKIFESQGNPEKYLQYFRDAVIADPAYAPAFLALYNYYSYRDVNKAREYLESYLAASDKDCNTDFFYADYLFRSGKYQESLDKSKAMRVGTCKDYPRLPLLFAYNYDRLGDSVSAVKEFESFMALSSPDKINSRDYLFGASILKKMNGGEETAIAYLKKALEVDTSRANRFQYMDTIAFLYQRMGKLNERLEWLKQSYFTNPSPNNRDIYNLAEASTSAGNFDLADSMSRIYIQKYPNQNYGYVLLSKSAIARDKDTTAGSAVLSVMEYIKFMENTDKVKYKNQIIGNYGYLVYVHANVLKDYPLAIQDLEGILAVDPENAYAKTTIEQIKKVMNQPKQPAKKATSASKG